MAERQARGAPWLKKEKEPVFTTSLFLINLCIVRQWNIDGLIFIIL